MILVLAFREISYTQRVIATGNTNIKNSSGINACACPRVYIAWKIYACKLRVEYPCVLHAWYTRIVYIPCHGETWSTPTFVVAPHVSTHVNVKL